jgi:hypothetical protein
MMQIQRNSAGIKAAWDLPAVPEGKRSATTTRPRPTTATATRRAPTATATAAAPAAAAATRPRPASAVTRRPSAPSAAAAAPPPPRVAKPRPASSKPRTQTLPPPPPADSVPPSPVDGPGITATHLDSLEGELRQALKDARKVYEDEKQLLRRHFKSVRTRCLREKPSSPMATHGTASWPSRWTAQISESPSADVASLLV